MAGWYCAISDVSCQISAARRRYRIHLNRKQKEKRITAGVSGGARGADTLAKQYATNKHYKYLEFPANWDLFGKSAGYIRNEEMHKFISQFKNRGALYFWDGESRGTAHNFDLDIKYNIKNFIIKYKEL
jgi:hypothetical protein